MLILVIYWRTGSFHSIDRKLLSRNWNFFNIFLNAFVFGELTNESGKEFQFLTTMLETKLICC